MLLSSPRSKYVVPPAVVLILAPVLRLDLLEGKGNELDPIAIEELAVELNPVETEGVEEG